MADVARRAGVSTATVSHVLNNTRAVSADTRAAVMAAVEETAYTPNTVARSLATNRTTTLGLVLSAISNPYFGELLSSAESAAAGAGYTLLLVDPHEDPEYERTVVARLHHHRVDGVVLAPSAEPTAALEYLARHEVPTVLLDRLVPDGLAASLDQVGSENHDATGTLTRHLVDHGHTRIALVAGLSGLTTTEERCAGFGRALDDAGVPRDPALEVSGESATEPARAAMTKLLALPEPPTAVVVGNNSMTIGVIAALRDAGARVPDDVAVVAFDDFAWADLFSPRLTVMAQPFDRIAAEAVRLLLRRRAQPDAPLEVLRLPPSFVVRESCGCDR
ncbi:LacI family DNA-binding transcriptional regulator [Actinomycetospora termitidis]|uniref:LacI family DNA-binding transcriptional regulator n=1 Tax=Actinomycetospora termitidis TaxID=3053470 RepID=A0ABT7MCR8_9PSEU|nr:LacI family DNA-binding transcriptional regulator [Actinomycetospora sp. Odt1-22]MDL5158455.1 LacI family DNA-binding transcriptional regulator [Actinomycetospora sp. Odt1-22]